MKFNCAFYILEAAAPWNSCPPNCYVLRDAPTEALAVTELGVRLIGGTPCMVFACDDAYVRAVPMRALSVKS